MMLQSACAGCYNKTPEERIDILGNRSFSECLHQPSAPSAAVSCSSGSSACPKCYIFSTWERSSSGRGACGDAFSARDAQQKTRGAGGDGSSCEAVT
jgi:hypothetical protein